MYASLSARTLIARILVGLACCTIAACTTPERAPLQYTKTGDIPPGPGLLTGADGAFTLEPGQRETTGRDARSPGAHRDGEIERFRKAAHRRGADRDEERLLTEYEEFLERKAWQDYQAWKRSRRANQ